MNIAIDKFFPVIWLDGSRSEVSLVEAFESAHLIRTIDAPFYTRVSIISLLSAVAQASVGSFHQSDSASVRSKLQSSAVGYLKSHVRFFSLYDKTRPFLQQPRVKKLAPSQKGNPLIGMVLDRASGNRTTHFDKLAPKHKTTDAEVAIGLISLQLFRCSSSYRKPYIWGKILTGQDIMVTAIGCSPLVSKLLVITEGLTLLDTIWYYVETEDRTGELKGVKPPWEIDFKSNADYESYCLNYYARLLPLYFAFYIDGGEIFEGTTTPFSKGVPNPWSKAGRHPMLVERHKTKRELKSGVTDPQYRNLFGGSDVWRQFGASLADADYQTDSKMYPQSISVALNDGKPFLLSVGGVTTLNDQGQGVSGFTESSIKISQRSDLFSFRSMFRSADFVFKRLESACKSYADAKNYITGKKKKSDLKIKTDQKAMEPIWRQYWSTVGYHRTRMYGRGDGTQTADEIGKAWLAFCYGVARKVFNSNTPILGSPDRAHAYGESIWALLQSNEGEDNMKIEDAVRGDAGRVCSAVEGLIRREDSGMLAQLRRGGGDAMAFVFPLIESGKGEIAEDVALFVAKVAGFLKEQVLDCKAKDGGFGTSVRGLGSPEDESLKRVFCRLLDQRDRDGLYRMIDPLIRRMYQSKIKVDLRRLYVDIYYWDDMVARRWASEFFRKETEK